MDFARQSRSGIVLQDLDCGVRIIPLLRSVGVVPIVPVGDDEVVHHRRREREGVLQRRVHRPAHVEVLPRLNGVCVERIVEPELRRAVADVGASDHRVEELRLVVHPDIQELDDLQIVL